MEALELLRRCLPVGGGRADSYVALSGTRGLRWILPAETGRLSGLLAAWQPYSVPARAAWGLIRLAAKGGFLPRLPGAEQFDAELSAADWRDYGWSQTEPPAVLAYVGTPGAHRKLVVTLADPRDGTGRLVVKCPLVDTAWEKIEREYTVLKALREEGREIAPVPVRIDPEKRFTVQTYLEGNPVGITLASEHYQFLAGLYQPEITISLQEVREQLLERRLALVENGGLSTEDGTFLDRLLHKNAWSGQLPGVRIHGDFAPWNLKRRKDNTICAVDWEDALPIGLPFYDLQFYKYNVDTLLKCNTRIRWGEYVNAFLMTSGQFDHATLGLLSEAAKSLVLIEIYQKSLKHTARISK